MKKIISIVSIILISGCSIAPKHPALKNNNLPELIPVRDMVANIKSNSNYKISPDGKWLAWKAVSGLRSSVFVRKLGEKTSSVMQMRRQGRGFRWAADSRHLLATDDAGGNENFHIYRYDILNPENEPVDITANVQGTAHIHRIVLSDPQHILITHNNRDKTATDLYRLNIISGKQSLIMQNPGNIKNWISDYHGKLRARVRYEKQLHTNYLDIYQDKDASWKKLKNWSEFENLYVIAFDNDRKHFTAISNLTRDKAAIVKINIKSGEESVLFKHPRVDTLSVLYSHNQQQLFAVQTYPDYPEQNIFDKKINNDFKNNFGKEKFGISFLSKDRDEQLFTFGIHTDKLIKYYLYNRNKGQFTLLGAGASQSYADNLSDYEPFSMQARDGMKLHGYLVRPKVNNQRPMPTVLLVHGGPWARHKWGYRKLSQFLANRGYLVLLVNYRGSTGYGKQYMNAAIGEFAGKMHDDLIDTVNWAINKNLADPDRVAIMGFSYGGYATLVGMTKTPDVFSCGIDIVGPADLESLIKDFPPYWRNWLHYWHRFVGDPDNPDDMETIRKKSPINYVQNIQKPILVIQGQNDVRVRRNQSDRMVQAMQKAGKEVEYILIKGEGHSFRKWKNRMKLFRKTEDYLANCLGGRSSGFDFYELGSWMF